MDGSGVEKDNIWADPQRLVKETGVPGSIKHSASYQNPEKMMQYFNKIQINVAKLLYLDE
jgi:hypothetical protein